MRQFYTIQISTLPADQIQHIKEICIGTPLTQRLCNDETEIFVKTTQELIDAKVNSGVPLTTLFPVGKTTQHSEDEITALLENADWFDYTRLA